MNNKKTKGRSRPPTRPPLPSEPVLRFTPTAWAKLLFIRDYGDTEIGGFAIAAGEDLLLIEDVQLVKQTCTPVSVAFDDESVADFFDRQVDRGRQPQQFARVWAHTHPGNCPQPSGVDEETFERVFGRSDWAVMFILASGGATYARLRFNVGPGGEIVIPVQVDFAQPFAGSEQDAWEQEYLTNVQPEQFALQRQTPMALSPTFDERVMFEDDGRWADDLQGFDDCGDDWVNSWRDYLGEPNEENAEVVYE